MYIKEINTTLDSFQLYSIFKDFPYSFFLDSGKNYERLGKFSFIGFNPHLVFKSKDNDITILEEGKEQTFTGDPFDKLREIFNQYQRSYETEFPFIGGLVGYLSYDLCHHMERLPRTAVDDVNIPDCYFGLYDGIIIVDHGRKKTFIASLGIKGDAEEIVESIFSKVKEAEEKGVEPTLANIDSTNNRQRVELKSNFPRKDYIDTVNKVREYIKSGDIYQANLTQRFQCEITETPYELYGRLRSINPAPFASFIDFGEGHIVSSSPERFIQIRKGMIETRPIKGTRPRGKTPEEDLFNRSDLLTSEKDQAELLMIVDLERNDLGKVSKTGTVKVPELFHLEEYPTVYHLVSTVQGEIKEEYDVIDCIKATFPGGSITGAPKIRAMEIIDELEPTQRNIYTGSIGYIGLNGDVDLNIVIRTIVCKDNKAYFQVGGGIVWDSDAVMEYEETLHKARALIQALNGKIISE